MVEECCFLGLQPLNRANSRIREIATANFSRCAIPTSYLEQAGFAGPEQELVVGQFEIHALTPCRVGHAHSASSGQALEACILQPDSIRALAPDVNPLLTSAA